jgi:hypothetical protein
VGTSGQREGPRGGKWAAAANIYTRWQRSEDPEQMVERSGQALRDALADEVRRDPAGFDLRPAMQAAGLRLVEVMQELRTGGAAGLASGEGVPPDQRVDAFIAGIAQRVVGSGGLYADALVRQAAVACAEDLLARDPQLLAAVRAGVAGALPIAGDLFCSIYQIFFAHTVRTFLQSAIAEKIKVVAPVLPVVDPAGYVADWIAQQIIGALPDPCERAGHSDAPSLAEVMRNLVNESVDRALGLGTQPAEANT